MVETMWRSVEQEKSLEQQIKDLEKELADLEAKRTELHNQLDSMKVVAASTGSAVETWADTSTTSEAWVDTNTTEVEATVGTSSVAATESTDNLWRRMTYSSVTSPEVDGVRLYRWWSEKITKAEVMEIVNALAEPYNTEVSDYIKNNNIKWLQKYLNTKIQSWEIDFDGLKSALNAKWIWLENNRILEDGKFWPQTLETIKFFVKEQPKEPEQPEGPKESEGPKNPDKPKDSVEVVSNLDWIPQEMSAAIEGIKNTDLRKNWSPERNWKDNDNFQVDKARKKIVIKTRGTALNDGEKKAIPSNRCEIDWNTWEISVVCKNYVYKLPVHLSPFELDKNGYPDGSKINNREMVRAFTDIWNLMNMLKAHAVFNWRWAIEYQDLLSDGAHLALAMAPLVGEKWIHLNNRIWWATDTELISDAKLNALSRKYSHLWLKFDRTTKIQVASLLTAMKYDLWNIRWNPDIERWALQVNPLNKEHVEWVKRYSKKYGRAS